MQKCGCCFNSQSNCFKTARNRFISLMHNIVVSVASPLHSLSFSLKAPTCSCNLVKKVENNSCPVKLIQSKCTKKKLLRKPDRHRTGNCNSLVCSLKDITYGTLYGWREYDKAYWIEGKAFNLYYEGGWLKRPHHSHLKKNKRTIHWTNVPNWFEHMRLL